MPLYCLLPQLLLRSINPYIRGSCLAMNLDGRKDQNPSGFKMLELGFFYHRFLYSALVLNTQAGYRKKIKHFSVEGLLQAGYMHAFYLTDRAELQSDGTYKAKKGIGKPQFIAGAGIGVGYDFGKVNRIRRIFINYDMRLQMPFVKSYVPLLPNGALSLGIQFNIQ
jgi:hypothetical protein